MQKQNETSATPETSSTDELPTQKDLDSAIFHKPISIIIDYIRKQTGIKELKRILRKYSYLEVFTIPKLARETDKKDVRDYFKTEYAKMVKGRCREGGLSRQAAIRSVNLEMFLYGTLQVYNSEDFWPYLPSTFNLDKAKADASKLVLIDSRGYITNLGIEVLMKEFNYYDAEHLHPREELPMWILDFALRNNVDVTVDCGIVYYRYLPKENVQEYQLRRGFATAQLIEECGSREA